jgi:hypothetical protein
MRPFTHGILELVAVAYANLPQVLTTNAGKATLYAGISANTLGAIACR